MAYTSLTPKRHWFLTLRKDRGRPTFHVFDQLTNSILTRNLPSLQAGKAELKRLKHLPMYREVATDCRPSIPWSAAPLHLSAEQS
jgi:hypothetical protein